MDTRGITLRKTLVTVTNVDGSHDNPEVLDEGSPLRDL